MLSHAAADGSRQVYIRTEFVSAATATNSPCARTTNGCALFTDRHSAGLCRHSALSCRIALPQQRQVRVAEHYNMSQSVPSRIGNIVSRSSLTTA